MGRQGSQGLTLDSGALISFENGDRRINVLIQRAKDLGRPLIIPAGVLAQVWRGDGGKQARLSLLLGSPLVVVQDLNRVRAQASGALCARSRTADIVDASVVIAAWGHGRVVATSDVGDLRHLDPSLTLIAI
jgi:hypothetical protein